MRMMPPYTIVSPCFCITGFTKADLDNATGAIGVLVRFLRKLGGCKYSWSYD